MLDVYGAHIPDNVRALASQLGINLIFVPACKTGELQPLDVGVFGNLQAMTDASWDPEDDPYDYIDAFQRNYGLYSPANIRKAFESATALYMSDILENSHHEQPVLPRFQAANAAFDAIEQALSDAMSG